MTGVRALRRADLPGLVDLYDEWSRAGNVRPPRPAEAFFARTLLDHPWADPELPSLVYEDESGALLGVLGTNARRLRCDGRSLRLAATGGFLVGARARGRGVGSALTERFLAGPQDLSINDAASEGARRVWVALGGHVSTTGSIAWRRVLRPGSAAAGSDWWARRPRPAGAALSALARPADTLSGVIPMVRTRTTPPAVATRTQVLTPEVLAEQVLRYRFHPDYDAAYLGWLFDVLDDADVPSRIDRRLVQDTDGRVLGWYVMHVVPRGTAQVLGLGGEAAAVVDHLLRAAFDAGAAVVEGRLEPGLLEVLRHRRCALVPSTWSTVHAPDPAVLAALDSPAALLTRLDGNWWNGFVVWRHEHPSRQRCVDSSGLRRGQ